MKTSMQLLKRSNGFYYILVRDEKGTQRWRSLRTKNKPEATILYNKFKKAYLEGKIKKLEEGVKNIPLQEFAEEYLTHIEYEREYNTFETYSAILKDFLKFIDGNCKTSSITSKDIDEYILYCKKKTKINNNVTINKKLIHLKSFFNKAIEWEYMKNNPVSTKQYLKVDKLPPRYLTSDEINKLLLAIDDDKFKVFVYMALLTGCRRNELLNLTWDDIDFKEKNITIKKTKSHYSRKMPFSDELYTVLYPIRGIGRIFHWTPDFTSEKFRNYAKKAGIKCRLHDLRHSFATHLLNSCGNIKVVQDLLGHRDIQSTMVYAHSISELNRNAINSLKLK